MSTNTPPFEVICVDDKGNLTGAARYYLGLINEGERYIVEHSYCLPTGEVVYKIKGIDYNPAIGGKPAHNLPFSMLPAYRSSRFRRIPPYQNSVSKELAERAMTNPIEVDKVIKPERVNN